MHADKKPDSQTSADRDAERLLQHPLDGATARHGALQAQSLRAVQLKSLQHMMNHSPQAAKAAQLQTMASRGVVQRMLPEEVRQLGAVANYLVENFPEYAVVGMGGSAAPVVAYLQSQGHAAFSIPLSIKGFAGKDMSGAQINQLRMMMEHSIEGLEHITKLVMVDVAGTGGSIVSGVNAIQTAYPYKQVLGAAIKNNDDSPNNKDYLQAVERGAISVVTPEIISKDSATDTSEFIDKLVGSAYKQYRNVGVFKPQENDLWQEYLQDEAGSDGFTHGSRERYQELVPYLKKVVTALDENSQEFPDPIHHPEYEQNLDSINSLHPKNKHKADEDEQAENRLKRIQEKLPEKQTMPPTAGNNDEAGSGCRCFLTTACTIWQGLEDDCIELETLRSFRDDYIRRLAHGEQLVAIYYAASPAIVHRINRLANPGRVYDAIYSYITQCVRRIWEEDDELAFHAYVELVLELHHRLTPEIDLHGADVLARRAMR